MQCVWNVLIDPLRNQPHDKLACSKPHPNPLVDCDLAKKQHQHQQQQQFHLKRKRTNSLETPLQKRQKSESPLQTTAKYENRDATSAIQAQSVASANTSQPSLRTDDDAQMTEQLPSLSAGDKPQIPLKSEAAPDADTEAKFRTSAHERIEANLNLQILLKHDELRLIEQELGKCQIALEQLRRCHVIPYPGQTGSQASIQNIISGSGPALEPPSGYSHPDYPAPFGVTDGPYSRHYAQWLIPDPAFDPSVPRQPRTSSFQAAPARSTRGSYDNHSGFTTPRVGRPSLASQNAASQGNYSVPRDRHAPLIVSRPSDGQLVKVVCKVCGKKDSANVQGFTNHCRIAHGLNYASHSEAIIDCGQPVSSDEAPAAANPTEAKVTGVVSTSQSASHLQTTPSIPHVVKPFVHPLITGPVSERQPKQSIFNGTAPPHASPKSGKKGKSKEAKSHGKLSKQSVGDSVGAEFVASLTQPNLSSLMKKRGFNGDLKALVTNAQQKIDLDQISPLVSDDDEDTQSIPTPTSATSAANRLLAKPKNRRGNTSGVRIPTRAPVGPSRLQINTSSVAGSNGSLSATSSLLSGSGNPTVQNAPGTSTSTAFLASSMEVDQHRSYSNTSGTSSANLSPHAPDNIPGLITDNEDDGDYMDSEQETYTNDEETQQRHKLVDLRVRVRDADEHSQQGDDVLRHFDHAKSSAHAPELANSVVPSRQNDAPLPTAVGVTQPRKRGRPRKNP